jgi:fructan beta-fructosidase
MALYHFSPPSGWMNDPNGLVYYHGKWHLFYQHIPDSESRQHWGHAFSHDLLHWQHLPIALYPDSLGNIWSGCVVVDEHDSSGFFDGGSGLVAVFTHQVEGAQRQSLAFSQDEGTTWTKYAHNPVLTGESPDFRDPKVFWHTPTSRWVMILATGGCVSFYNSHNLKKWSYTSSFGADWVEPGNIWECPDIFPLGVDGEGQHIRWVLHASLISNNETEHGFGACRMRYFTGNFDGFKFHPEYAAPTSYGADDYAGITWNNAPDAERIFISWLSNWAYAWTAHHQGQQEQMSIPRRLALKAFSSGIALVQTPAIDLQPLLSHSLTWDNFSLANGRMRLVEHTGDAFKLQVEFEPASAREFGLSLRQGSAEHTLVGYDAAHNLLFLDRMQSSNTLFSQVGSFHPRFNERHTVPLAPHEGCISLDIFVDQCSVEVFGNDGQVVLSDLIYPQADSQALEIFAVGGEVHIVKMILSSIQEPTLPAS